MYKDKFKYYQNLIRISLFRLVVIFSILSFSGINLQSHSAFTESFRTELVESRIQESEYRYDKNLKRNNKKLSTNSVITERSFVFFGLINFTKLIKTKFKSYRNRLLLNTIPSQFILFKIPLSLSDDVIPDIHKV